MRTNFIDKATFSEVYRFLKGKPDSDIFQCFKNLFGIVLLFFPALVSKEIVGIIAMNDIADIATGATLAGAGVGTIVSKAAKAAFGLFKNKDHIDYETRYAHMQIAQVMLVYASYFDTISQCLPNENEEIVLSPDAKMKISHDGFQEYIKKYKESFQLKDDMPKLLDREVALPTPTQNFSLYINDLENYYIALNDEFIKFFESISFWKEIDKEENNIDKAQKKFFSDLLNKLPQKAICTYKEQYFELSKEFPEFALWANQMEHSMHKEQMDIGFKRIAEQLRTLYDIVKNIRNEASDTLEHYNTKYTEYINEAIIKSQQGDFDEDIVFPSKKDIFIPQAFHALTYQKSMQLEQNDTWKDSFYGEEIGLYIRNILCHPKYGEAPMLILGLPGAGKTLLCNMLAAQILSAEYYVIIINLRDVNADDTIMKQIDAQIENDLGDDCSWCDLRKTPLDKPLVLIFDGYDELLQASGKTYSNYLNKIAEFQREQKSIYQVLVRCIITSRVTLIDKASIPSDCHILRLCDFDSTRTSIWCDIWNEANEHYFKTHNLKRLEIAPTGKINELAKQPLLLLMLAIYDINNNCLQEQGELGRAELYFNLIRDFIEREKKKDPSFSQGTQKNQKKAIQDGFRSLGIVALGMYNRRQLYIRTADLNRDVSFFANGSLPVDDIDENILEEADKHIIGFFFVCSSKATVQISGSRSPITAYEFLHNTFGEFLTAHFILDIMFRLIKRQIIDMEEEVSSWTEKLKMEWHISLAYEPLFKRPVVLNMIHELSEIIAEENGIRTVDVQTALDKLFHEEIKHIITGSFFSELNNTLCMQGNPFKHPELMVHVATYSINLILLKSIVCSKSFNFTRKLGTDSDWHKLTYIWRYAFSEEDLAGLSWLITLNHTEKGIQLSYNFDEKVVQSAISLSKLDRLCRISSVLGDDVSYALFSVFNIPINSKIRAVLEREDLKIETQYALKAVVRYLMTSKTLGKQLEYLLEELIHCCEKEKDILGMYIYCALLHSLIEIDLLNKDIIVHLLNINIVEILRYILVDIEFNCKWLFLCIIFQEIMRCINALPNKMRQKLLTECMRLYAYESRRIPDSLQRFDITAKCITNIFSLLNKGIQSTIDKYNRIEIGDFYFYFLRDIQYNYRLFSWKEIMTILRICQSFRKAGMPDWSNKIFTNTVYQIKEKNPDILLEECYSSCLSSLIECCYYSMQDQKKQYEENYLWPLSQYHKMREIVNKLLPSYERAFYYLICMIYDDKMLAWQFGQDLPSDLSYAIQRYGNQLSHNILMKIKEYGELIHNKGIKIALENIKW